MINECRRCRAILPGKKELCISCTRIVENEGKTPIEPNKINTHLDICHILNDIYQRKNADYGDSFAKLRNEIPSAILVRIYDKYSRLKNLLEGSDQLVLDESIDDSLLDLANYCILELIERKLEGKK